MSKKYGTIASYGEALIANAETLVDLGSRSPTIVRDYRQRLESYCKPFFGDQSIRTINTKRLREFVRWLSDRGLKATTIQGVLSFVSMTLKLAAEDGVIQAVPLVPRPSAKDSPRPWLSEAEYKNLLRTLRKLERARPPILVRDRWPIEIELRYFVTFMVHTFLRPGDAFGLTHRHIEIVEEVDRKFLRLSPPTSKTSLSPIISMPVAVDIYRRLQKRGEKAGYGKPGDYVFLPGYKGRNYAQEIFRRQLSHAFTAAGIKTSAGGGDRTTYSLRHTAIMFRLIKSDGLDLLTLARNCRTSVEMIDRFYARHLTAEMNLAKLQSMKHPTRYR